VRAPPAARVRGFAAGQRVEPVERKAGALAPESAAERPLLGNFG